MEAEYKGLSTNDGVSWTHFLRQFLVNSIALMFYFMFGLSLGAPTVLLPQLRKEANSTEAASEDMASWIASIGGYMGVPWSVALPIIMYYFGRRKSCVFVVLNTFTAFIVLYCSTDATQILISQVLQGVNAASQTSLTVIIMTEYTSPEYRGIFCTTKSVMMYLGVWVANAIGMFFHWSNIAVLGIACSVYNFVAILIMPESPYWLVSQEKITECVSSHRWLKGFNKKSDTELNDILNNNTNKSNRKYKSISSRLKNCYVSLLQEEVYKALLISLLVVGSCFMSGKMVCAVVFLLHKAIEILHKITKNESTAYYGMLIIDAITICGMMVGSVMSKFIKQKVLLLWSLTAGTSSLYIICLYLFLVNSSFIFENTYVSLGLLIIFSLTISCGAVMALSIFGETLPLKCRGVSVCIVSMFAKTGLGTVLKISPILFKHFGNHGCFLCYAIVSTVLIILMLKFLPETKNKTLHEIANSFKTKDIGKKSESSQLQQG